MKISKKLRDDFGRIFSAADVVDLDFSLWDKYVTLIVFTDHWVEWKNNLEPLAAVYFENVMHFSSNFPPIETQMENPQTHLPWHLSGSEIEERKSSLHFQMSGGDRSPSLSIECKSIRMEELSPAFLDDVYPNWKRVGSGLARPGIIELARKNAKR